MSPPPGNKKKRFCLILSPCVICNQHTKKIHRCKTIIIQLDHKIQPRQIQTMVSTSCGYAAAATALLALLGASSFGECACRSAYELLPPLIVTGSPSRKQNMDDSPSCSREHDHMVQFYLVANSSIAISRTDWCQSC